MKKLNYLLFIRIFLISSICLAHLTSNAQGTNFEVVQRRILGGSGIDVFTKIIKTSDGGFLLGGITYSNDQDVSGFHGGNFPDIWIVRMNSAGAIEWKKAFGGTGFDDIADIAQLQDGNYLLTGRTNSSDGDVVGHHGTNNFDIWVIKISPQGNILSQKSLGGAGDESIEVKYLKPIIAADGSIIIVGSTNSNDGDVVGFHGANDVWIVKLNNDLSFAWQKCLGGSDNESPFGVAVTADNSIVISSNTSSNDGDVTGNHSARDDIWVVKLNSINGSLLWQKCYGGSEDDWAGGIALADNGDYLVTGSSFSNNGDVSGHHGSINNSDFWTFRINSSGTLLWQKSYGGTNFDVSYVIKKIPGDAFLLTGYTQSVDGDVAGGHPQAGSGDQDIWFIKMTGNNGSIVWQKPIGGSLNEEYQSSEINADGGVVFLGTTLSTDGDLSGIQYKNFGWLVKLNAAGTIDWQKRFGGYDSLGTGTNNYAEGRNFITLPGSNSYLVAGISNFSENHPLSDISIGKGNLDAFVFKIGNYNTIQTRAYRDYNKNNLRDANEPYVSNGLKIASSKSNDSVVSVSSNTYFKIYVDTGTYSTKFVPEKYTALPLSKQSVFTGYNAIDSFEFALTPIWSKIFGYVFIDVNGNGIKDASEVYATNVLAVSKKGNDSAQSILKNGFFENPVDTGLYTTRLYLVSDEYTVSPSFVQTNVLDYKIVYNVNFALRPYLNNIKGSIYYDRNKNGIKEQTEPYANGVIVKSEKNGSVVEGASNAGVFSNLVDTGTFVTSLKNINSNYYSILPVSKQSVFTNYRSQDSVSFALQPIAGKKDYRINLLPLTPARPGFNVTYKIQYENVGTDTLTNKQVKLFKDRRFSFLSAQPVQSTINVDTLIWNINSLFPGDSAGIIVQLKLSAPPVTNNGDTLVSRAVIDSTGDLVAADNTSLLRHFATGSYDPNDKLSSAGTFITKDDISVGKSFTYTIRFQNTGTDTAFNIVIRDTLDAKLDWSSMQMVAASHPYQLAIKGGKYCTWTFANIKLVDSVRNEPASHGYLAYSIQPKKTLNISDSIKNSASIYFDFNQPVKTNTATTVVKVLTVTPVIDVNRGEAKIVLFPNPVNNGKAVIQFRGRINGDVSVTMTDIIGRKLYQKQLGRLSADLYNYDMDLSGRAAGIYFINIIIGKKSYPLKVVVQ